MEFNFNYAKIQQITILKSSTSYRVDNNTLIEGG